MNPFGQELRKILTQCKTSGVVSYAGRSAYIQLDPDLRARLEFVSLNIAGQYNALKLPSLLEECGRLGAVDPLIDAANRGGGGDNITAVVIAQEREEANCRG